jgi:nitrite reductase/ring-hydroxylating ferredoxin subunit
MAVDGVAPGEIRRVDSDGRSVFVRLGDDGWQVYDSRCPHQTTDIPHLALEGCTLTCPKHDWAFDLRSGDCIKKGNSPLKRWPSQVVDGRLQARW